VRYVVEVVYGTHVNKKAKPAKAPSVDEAGEPSAPPAHETE
jgi:hypothetical protein